MQKPSVSKPWSFVKRMSEKEPNYTAEMVEKSNSELLASLINSYVEEVEKLKKYERLFNLLENAMKEDAVRLIAPVLADGEFSEFMVLSKDAIHYSSKLVYALEGGIRKFMAEKN